ncbi:MAG: type II secretion system protein [Verrucomicrobia bacterium]|nr:type II secretion system protein [Verrucomicrobiota bacterium]
MKKRPFSLIEVVIACFLLAICGTACVIYFDKAGTERRAKHSLQLIEQKLQQAFLIARMVDGQVAVIITNLPTPKISMSTDMPVSPGLKPLLTQSESLEAISDVRLVQVAANTKEGHVRIIFYPTGVDCPEGCLEVMAAGTKASFPLKKYVVDGAFHQIPEITQIFPDEVIKHEKEKKELHSH